MVESKKDDKKSGDIHDLLHVENDPEITKQFIKRKIYTIINQIADKEVLLWSSKLSKFNKYNWVQERNLVVTQFQIYNFKGKSKNE